MQVKIFCIPLPGGEEINEEMNRFLGSHNVLQTESQVVSASSGSFWRFAIKYFEGAPQGRVEKVDYRQVLAPLRFQRFSEMRKLEETDSNYQAGVWPEHYRQRRILPLVAFTRHADALAFRKMAIAQMGTP